MTYRPDECWTTEEWIEWALSVNLTGCGGSGMGQSTLRVMLIAMVLFVDDEGYLAPGDAAIANAVQGKCRRDARQAMSYLMAGGLAVRVGKVGRNVQYLLTP